MTDLRLIHLRSVADLRAASVAWDNLWQRSTVSLPTARAAMVAHWMETLAPGQPFHALAIEQDGRYLAALPLVETRLKRLLKAGRLPCNEWSSAGELLLDPAAPASVIDRLIDGVVELRWPLVWFDGVPLDQPHWQQFLEGLERRAITYKRHERFKIGVVDLLQDWEAYQAAWSGNFRRQMRKMTRRAEELGGVSLSIHHPTDNAELERLLQTGFEVEDRSWKGRDGTSVLKSPEMHRYLRGQAALLAELGHLELVFLEFEGKAIAFEYGLLSKGTYYSPKVGYDEAFSHLSPGQMLRLKMMERFLGDSDRRIWDFLGPLVEATERWTTVAYAIERLVVAPGGVQGKLAMRAYRDWWPAVRSLRDRWRRKKSNSSGPIAAMNAATAPSVDR